MTNNELRYVQITMEQYESMIDRIRRKESIQFTADELRLLLRAGYPYTHDNVNSYMELREKIYTILLEVERSDQ